MVFTVVLTEPQDVLDRIADALRTKLRAENSPRMTLPPVTLAPVDYLSGDVRLLVIQDDNLVKRIATSRPSLFADNTAFVAVGLPELGAALFPTDFDKYADMVHSVVVRLSYDEHQRRRHPSHPSATA